MTSNEQMEYCVKLRKETGFHDINVNDIKFSPATRHTAKLLVVSTIGNCTQLQLQFKK
jgi:hypothetical protein